MVMGMISNSIFQGCGNISFIKFLVPTSLRSISCILNLANQVMTERELIKLEGTIRMKMEQVKKQKVTLKDSGLGGLMNSLKKVDEVLYDKIFPEYKEMASKYNIFK